MEGEKEKQKHKCVICDMYFEGFGHNPEPVRKYEEGRACDGCNAMSVIPARLGRMIKKATP